MLLCFVLDLDLNWYFLGKLLCFQWISLKHNSSLLKFTQENLNIKWAIFL